MHVLAVSHAYPTSANTSHGIFIHRLHRGLRDLGARVDVLQLAEWVPPRPLSDAFRPWRDARRHRHELLDEVEGIRVHHPLVVTPRPSRFFRDDAWSRAGRAVARFCARDPELAGADVVLGHFMVPDGFHALRLARALGLPVAAFAWGDDVHAWPAQSGEWRERLVHVLGGIDLPIACSQRLVEDGNSWLPAPRNDWRVVYAGVDLEQFGPERDRATARSILFEAARGVIPEDAHVLLMAGQPVREKGYLELLDAWSAVAPGACDWHLVMIGGAGPLDVTRLVQERGLSGKAHWIGLQPASRVPDLMRASDAFVLPSHNEGLSLSVLEALATGLPTIATDVGGHSEVIRSPDDGWLIPPRDEAALRAALIELVSKPAERARRGSGGRKAAQRIGSPNDNASRLLSVLGELVTEPRRQTAVVS